MRVALRNRPMTEQQFLQWVAPRDERYEFDGERPVAMVGNTLAHGIIQINLITALHARLAGSPWRLFASDQFARVDMRLRVPDVMVVARDVRPAERVVSEPRVVFEILSPSTAYLDRFTKAEEYWATLSIQHYVMLEQDRVAAVVLSRGAASWARTTVVSGGDITLPAVEAALPLAPLYDGLDLSEPASEGE